MRFNTRGDKTEVRLGAGDQTAPDPKRVNALRDAHAMFLPGSRNAPRYDRAPEADNFGANCEVSKGRAFAHRRTRLRRPPPHRAGLL